MQHRIYLRSSRRYHRCHCPPICPPQSPHPQKDQEALLQRLRSRACSIGTVPTYRFCIVCANLKSTLLWVTYMAQSMSTNVKDLFTRTFIAVLRSGRRRSCTLAWLVYGRFTFSFCCKDLKHVCFDTCLCTLTQSISARDIHMPNTSSEK